MNATAKFLSLSLFAFLALLILPAAGSTAQEPDAETGATQKTETQSELEKSMKALKKGMRFLSRNLENPQAKERVVQTLQSMQSSAIATFSFCPAPFTKEGNENPEKWDLGFRQRILDMTQVLLHLESAVFAKDSDQVKASWQKLRDLKKDGHSIYEEEDEDESHLRD